MAMTAYTGLPRSGKSYEVANGPILKAAQKGRPVWTNIPVNIEGVTVIEHDPENLHWYLKAPPGALVAIDECWRYWPSGAKANEISEDVKEWLTMHGHRTANGMETEVVLVTQDLSQIASFVRNLVVKTYRMRKLSEIGSSTRYRVDVYSGAVTGQKPPRGQHVSGWLAKYKPQGFARYRSHTLGEPGQAADADARGVVWKRPAVIAIPVMALALLFIVPRIVHALGGDRKAQESVVAERSEATPTPARSTAATAPQAQPIEPVPTPVPTPAGPQESKRWVLVGVVMKSDGTGIAYLDSANGRRRIPAETCKRDLAKDWRCVVDGEVVAMWTGNGALRLVQASTYQDSSQ